MFRLAGRPLAAFAALTMTSALGLIGNCDASKGTPAAAPPPPVKPTPLAPAAASPPSLPTSPPVKPSPSLRIRAATAKYPNLVVVYQSKALLSLYTIMRDKNTSHRHFTAAADRVLRLLAEEGLAEVRSLQHVSVQTPVGPFEGLKAREDEDICVVSIVRAGDTLQEAIRLVSPGALLGKILIQRDEDTPEKHPKLFFTKLPPSSKMKKVLLVDPMLATGQSCILAIKELLRVGVKEEDITFLNLLACPEGLDTLFSHYPQVRVVTGAIDEGLNEHMYIVPGLGDYGDRYYGTVSQK